VKNRKKREREKSMHGSLFARISFFSLIIRWEYQYYGYLCKYKGKSETKGEKKPSNIVFDVIMFSFLTDESVCLTLMKKKQFIYSNVI
jgi:hypothetical protein